jgi:hypothetical protein
MLIYPREAWVRIFSFLGAGKAAGNVEGSPAILT